MGFFGRDDKQAVAEHKKAVAKLRVIEKQIGIGGVDADSTLGRAYQEASDQVRETEKGISGWRRHHLIGK